MNCWIIVFVFLVLFCCVLWFTKISLKVMACYTPNGSAFLIQVRIWFIHYTFNVLEMVKKRKKKPQQPPKSDASDEKKMTFGEQLEKLPELIKSVGEIHTIGKGFSRHIKVSKFLWRSHLGTGDAATTGITAGYLWSVKGMLVGVMSHYTKLVEKPELEIVPIFQGQITTTEFECVASFRIGQALRTGLTILRYVRKKRTVFAKDATEEVTS